MCVVSLILIFSIPFLMGHNQIFACVEMVLFGMCGLSGSMFGFTYPESDWYKTNKIRKDAVMVDYSSKEVKLVQTCGACPEQYDMYLDGRNFLIF